MSFSSLFNSPTRLLALAPAADHSGLNVSRSHRQLIEDRGCSRRLDRGWIRRPELRRSNDHSNWDSRWQKLPCIVQSSNVSLSSFVVSVFCDYSNEKLKYVGTLPWKFRSDWQVSLNCFFKKGPSSASFSFIFCLFKQVIQILQQIIVKKSIQYLARNSNSQPSDLESSSLTTRPELQSI